MKKTIVALFFVSQFCFSNAAVPVVSSKNDTASAYVSKEDEVMVKNAMKAFTSLSKTEKKAKMLEVKSMLKEYKANKASGDGETNTILLAILAILLPPLAVYLHENTINSKFWISILLTLCFWIPGVIYALIVVL